MGIEQILTATTVLIAASTAAVTAVGATWLSLRKQRSTADDKAKALAHEQRDLEVRMRQEQIAASTAQATLESTSRAEIIARINEVREYAGRLEHLLRESEDENRLLRRRVLELELQIVSLRHQINGGKSAHLLSATGEETTTLTTTLTTERTDTAVVHTEAEAAKE